MLPEQLDYPVPSAGSSLHSVSASDIEESISKLRSDIVEDSSGRIGLEFDEFGEHFVDTLLVEIRQQIRITQGNGVTLGKKDARSYSRGQRLLCQRARMYKRQMICRSDIDFLSAPFLAIYVSLISPEEEKAKQKQLLTLLEKLISKEWPKAQFYLYGSCANSFGVSKSDVDVCLATEEAEMNESEILLKLAGIAACKGSYSKTHGSSHWSLL